MFSISSIVILFFAESVITWGHSTKSSTILTTTFLPIYPFVNCDHPLSNHATEEVSLFSISHRHNSYLEPTLEKLKRLENSTAKTETLDANQRSEISHALFGVDFPENDGANGVFWSGKFLLCVLHKLMAGYMKNIGTVLCECNDEIKSIETKCAGIASLSQALGCNAGPKCPLPYAPPLISPIDKTVVNLPMSSLLPTPAEIPQDIIKSEMRTYYLLWQSISALSYNSASISCGLPFTPTATTIEGWELVFTSNLGEVKKPHEKEVVPFATLAKRANAKDASLVDYLVTFRETQSSTEWGINFAYNQILQDFQFLNNTPLHRGFVGLANSVFVSFDPLLREANDGGRLGLITVTGHSLGGGVAAAFTFLLSRFYPKTLSSGENRIRAVLFAAPNLGGIQYTTEMANNVVMRSITSEFDPVPEIPCNNSPLCPNTPMPTSRDFKSTAHYNMYPGLIQIMRNNLPPLFSKPFINTKILLWHICSYDCWTSTSADPGHLSGCEATVDPKNPNAKCRYA